jgi:beta-glucosidase-like glycosyl hydrolase
VIPWAELVLPSIRWDPEHGYAKLTPQIERWLALGVGGFILFGGERDAMRGLIRQLQAAATHPLLIASDLERGAGQQVRELTGLPPLLGLGRLGVDAVREAARLTAREARDVGINWVFAPVVDLDLEPANPIVQTRAFGDDPEAVGALGAAWIMACQAGGVLACAKHYPGHGRTLTDSHAELPVVASSRLALDADIVPFRMAVEAGVASVMTAHVAYPALDPSGAPATYSRPIVGHFLRGELGFDGLVVTDALVMKGALQGLDETEGAVRAIGAGCDLLLYPEDVAAVAHALEKAAASGAVEAERLEEAAMRRREALQRVAEPMPLEQRELEEGRVRGLELGRAAVRVVRGTAPPPPRRARVEIVDDDAGGPYPLPPRSVFAETLREGGVDVAAAGEATTPGGSGPGEDALIVLVFADVKSWKCRAGLSAGNALRLAELARDATVVVLFGHERRIADVPGTCPVVCAWSGDAVMQRAAAQRLLAG